MWCIRNRLKNQKNTSTVWKTILPVFSTIEICYKIHMFGNNFVRWWWGTSDQAIGSRGLPPELIDRDLRPRTKHEVKMSSIIVTWRTLEKTRTLPRADLQPKLTNVGKSISIRVVTKSTMSPLAEIQGSSVQNEHQLVISPSFIVEPRQKACPMNRHHSTNI